MSISMSAVILKVFTISCPDGTLNLCLQLNRCLNWTNVSILLDILPLLSIWLCKVPATKWYNKFHLIPVRSFAPYYQPQNFLIIYLQKQHHTAHTLFSHFAFSLFVFDTNFDSFFTRYTHTHQYIYIITTLLRYTRVFYTCSNNYMIW